MLLGLMSFIFTTADSLSFACIFLMVLGSFLNFIIMKEPPRYLFRKGKISDGFKALQYIAKKNKTGLTQNQILELMDYPRNAKNPFKSKVVISGKEKTKDSKPQESIFKLLLAKDCLSQMIRLTSISCLLYIVFYVSSVSISDNLGLEKIQYNEMVMGVSQMVGYAVMIPYLHKIRRVRSTLYILFSIFVIGAILLSITILNLDKVGGILHGMPYQIISVTSGILINIINSSLFTVYFAFAAELFDVGIRGMAIGIPTLAGKLLGSLSPQIADLARYYGVSILGMSVIPVCLALPLVIGMRETLETDAEGGSTAEKLKEPENVNQN